MIRLSPGSIFYFMGAEWVCIDPEYHESLDQSVVGIFAMQKYPLIKPTKSTDEMNDEFRFSNENSNRENPSNYRWSNIRLSLNELAQIASESFGEDSLFSHKVDLTALNGTKDFGVVCDRFFIPTLDEYREYNDVMSSVFKSTGRIMDNVWPERHMPVALATPYNSSPNPSSHLGIVPYICTVQNGFVEKGMTANSYLVYPCVIINPENITPTVTLVSKKPSE